MGALGVQVKAKQSILVERQDKKVYAEVIGKDIYSELEKMSNLHPKLMEVSIRLANYLSECVRDGEATLLDIILSEALTEWSTRYIEDGCNVAYQAFCKSIFKQLAKMYEYRVTGKRGYKPFHTTYWDCTRIGITQWMRDNQIREAQIVKVHMDSAASQRESALIIAPQIFDRSDLTMWGFPDPLEQRPVMESMA
jgi:hypothetical protein